MKDLLNAESSQRVDLRDFLFAIDEGQQGIQREVMSQFMLDPNVGSNYKILEGFAMDNPSGSQLQVTRGRAILGQREGSLALASVLTTSGDVDYTVDIAGYTAGTYGIFIRFELVDTEAEIRAFWDPSGGGAEYSQTIPTRRVANWSLRIEATSPGSEWMKIGEVDQATMVIKDLRDFYFEGIVDAEPLLGTWTWNGTTVVAATDTTQVGVGDWVRLNSDGQFFQILTENPNVSVSVNNAKGLSIPTGATGSAWSAAPYLSGWSAEGGGASNDRHDARDEFGVYDLGTFSAAIRQCIEDIKGRGLRRWWDVGIGGMNIGFNADPVENKLAVSAADFYFGISPTSLRRLQFDSRYYIEVDTFATGTMDIYAESTRAIRLDTDGILMEAIDNNYPTLKIIGGNNESAFASFSNTAAYAAVIGTNISTGEGVRGLSTSGYGGLFAGDSGASPAKGSMFLTPQDDDPTDVTLGSFYTNQYTGLAVANGTTWERVVKQSYLGVDASGTDQVTTTGPFSKTYTIPANLLRDGSQIRIRATVIQLAAGGTGSATIMLYFGGNIIGLINGVLAGLSDYAQLFDAHVAVRDTGSGNFEIICNSFEGHSFISSPYGRTDSSYRRYSGLSFAASQAITVAVFTNPDPRTFELASLLVDVT